MREGAQPTDQRLSLGGTVDTLDERGLQLHVMESVRGEVVRAEGLGACVFQADHKTRYTGDATQVTQLGRVGQCASGRKFQPQAAGHLGVSSQT